MTATIPKDYVLTPGGYRHKDNVHILDKDHAVRSDGLRLHKVHRASGKSVELPSTAVPEESVLPATSGWNAYAYWTNSTGKMFKTFTTSWVVPYPPTRPFERQTIFFFNGIQNTNGATGILQPVLQWGHSYAGGGEFWSIANWWVQGQNATVGQLVRVNSGQGLEGVMSVVSGSGNSLTYDSVFTGYPEANLQVQNLPPLDWFNETLETYGVDSCKGYPPRIYPVRFTGIDITLSDNSNPSTIPWTIATGSSNACDEVAKLASKSATNGEVDIYYGYAWPTGSMLNDHDSTPLTPASCVFQDKLYLFWKANDSSNHIFQSSSSDGGIWPDGQTINGSDSTPQSPACCVFDNKIYTFWTANDSSNHIFQSSSADGQTWPNGQTINGVDSTPLAPACCVFNDKLYTFWNNNNSIFFSASTDGQTWPNGQTINGIDSTAQALACCVFNDKLYLFWAANDFSKSIYYSASTDGETWPSGQTINDVDYTSLALGCSVFNEHLFVFWKANTSNNIFYSTSENGDTWPAGNLINDVDTTSEGVGCSVFKRTLYAFWKANDSGNGICYSAPRER